MGPKWPRFIQKLKSSAEKDDPDQMFVQTFFKICKSYGIEFSDSQRQNLLYSYPGRDEGNMVRVNIYPIYDLKYNMMQKKVYDGLDLHEPDKKEEAVDACGYTGIFHRKHKDKRAITEEEWIRIVNLKNQT